MLVSINELGKQYYNRWIFKNLNLEVPHKQKIAILGINGSGKSTLLQCISGHVTPTTGIVTYTQQQQQINPLDIYKHISFCSPAMQIIEDLTLTEFLEYHFKLKNALITAQDAIAYLGLQHAADKRIEVFSSGMKQRVKLAQALMVDVPITFLDEPCSNLDQAGIAQYHKMVQEFGNNKTIFVSSNDTQEYTFCDKSINVQELH